MESLFIQLSDDVYIQTIDPYDWFCGPGSHIWWEYTAPIGLGRCSCVSEASCLVWVFVKDLETGGSNIMSCLYSVKFVEGTVTSLEEEDGCVTGIQYREKDSGIIKVVTHWYVVVIFVKVWLWLYMGHMYLDLLWQSDFPCCTYTHSLFLRRSMLLWL